MTGNTTDTNQDPAAIEQDIRRTQEDMSRTVDKIGDQLTFRNIFNALLDKADENDVDARMLVDGARRNPIALGLIAAGAIWLVSDKDSNFPSLPRKSRGETDKDDQDIHHRDYVSHMSAVEMREGEDPLDYQRRRDLARANFLMCERRHDEDDHSFRQRLDDMTESFREKRAAWFNSSNEAASATAQKMRTATAKTQHLYNSNPLVGGTLAAAVGAAVGSSLPITRQEQEKLGGVGERARELASEQTDQIESRLHETKDEVLERTNEKLQQGGSDQGSAEGRPELSRA